MKIKLKETDEIAIDVTEIEYPKRSQTTTIRVKKRHTLKVQIIADAKKQGYSVGGFHEWQKKHNKKILDDSYVEIGKNTLAVVDLGYKGLENVHRKMRHSDKEKERTREEIEFNRKVSKGRIYIEFINRYLKRF